MAYTYVVVAEDMTTKELSLIKIIELVDEGNSDDRCIKFALQQATAWSEYFANSNTAIKIGRVDAHKCGHCVERPNLRSFKVL